LVWRRGDTNPNLAAFTAHVAETIANSAHSQPSTC